MRATPPLALPIGPNRLVALDEAGLDAIHRASLEVLERTWVVVPSARVRVRLTGAARGWATSQGASACPRPARALPAPFVEEAIARAPATYTLAGREPALALMTRLADAPPEIGFPWQGSRPAAFRSPSGRSTSCGSSWPTAASTSSR